MITPEILPNDSPGVTPNLPRQPEPYLPPVQDDETAPAQPPAFQGRRSRRRRPRPLPARRRRPRRSRTARPSPADAAAMLKATSPATRTVVQAPTRRRPRRLPARPRRSRWIPKAAERARKEERERQQAEERALAEEAKRQARQAEEDRRQAKTRGGAPGQARARAGDAGCRSRQETGRRRTEGVSRPRPRRSVSSKKRRPPTRQSSRESTVAVAKGFRHGAARRVDCQRGRRLHHAGGPAAPLGRDSGQHHRRSAGARQRRRSIWSSSTRAATRRRRCRRSSGCARPRRTPAIFAIALQADPDLILQSMRAGANEFFTWPPPEDTFHGAIRRTAARRETTQGARRPRRRWCSSAPRAAQARRRLPSTAASRSRGLSKRSTIIVDLKPGLGEVALVPRRPAALQPGRRARQPAQARPASS